MYRLRHEMPNLSLSISIGRWMSGDSREETSPVQKTSEWG